MPLYTVIQLLTMAALTGLLFASGLRLNATEVIAALQDRPRLFRTLVVNFLVVPALALGAVVMAGLPRDQAVGVLLLAAAPFAPVVPVFTRMARGDLALAAAFTALFPVFSAFLTPWIAAMSLRFLPGSSSLQFDVMTLLIVLLATITLPLVVGIGINQRWPGLCRKLLRPVEITSEAIGAVSLVFVSVVEWKSIVATGWASLVTTMVVFELAMALGFWLGGPAEKSRRVIAFGTGNRNIALAILIAARSFPGTPAVAAVVANGLLMIGLGLLHTAWWRFASSRRGNEAD